MDTTGFDDKMKESAYDNTYLAPLADSIIFITCDMIPILSQLMSLVFGIIRKRKIDKQEKFKALNFSAKREYQMSGVDDDDLLSMDSNISMPTTFFDPPINMGFEGMAHLRMKKDRADS